MDEVKSKKVALKSPKVSASVQKVARDQILEFIKNRPPLKSVNERKLNARKTEETPAENLMNEIRGGRARQSLRRTNRRKSQSMAEGFGKVVEKPTTSDKQIINLDLSFASTICNFDDESPVSSPEPCLDHLYDDDLFHQEYKKETFSTITPKPRNFDVSTPMPSSSEERPEQDLTLEEVSHIRTQITRGELEQLDLPVGKKMDYDKGLIC